MQASSHNKPLVVVVLRSDESCLSSQFSRANIGERRDENFARNEGMQTT